MTMRTLLSCLLACVLFVPACGMDVELQLGTLALKTKLAVDDWAQANVLKALDELIAGDGEPVPDEETISETE